MILQSLKKKKKEEQREGRKEGREKGRQEGITEGRKRWGKRNLPYRIAASKYTKNDGIEKSPFYHSQ